MKRLAIFLFVIVILLAIKHDITKGTLPTLDTEPLNEKQYSQEEISFFKHKISRGETLLSIVEEHLQGPLPVSIDELIADFNTLNEAVRHEEMQVGKIYKFPNYELEY